MANTYGKLPLRVYVPSNSFESLFEREYQEGAAQTFPVGSPLKASSGLAIVWVNPTDAPVLGFSITAASGVTGAVIKAILATPEVGFEANLLGSAAADYTLLAADLFKAYDLVSSSTLLGAAAGSAGWYIAATTSDVACRVTQFDAEQPIANSTSSRPVAGDINARVKARIEKGKSLWY